MARSPPYPQLPLEQCIDLVRKVYKGAHTASVDTGAIISEMGYSGRSGRSLSAIGALKQFGLLEGRDDSVRVTKLALTILEPIDQVEFAQALRSASIKPELFAEIRREFGDQRPSEGVIRSIAIRKYDFTDTGAERLAKSFMDTMSYVDRFQSKLIVPESTPDAFEDKQAESPAESVATKAELEVGGATILSHIPGSAAATVLVFKLSPSSTAHVQITGNVTPTAIDRLIKHLELSKEALVEEPTQN